MIEREDAGDVAVVRLAHGPVNAMDLELCEALTAECRSLATSRARAVVLTGRGPCFSAGADLHRYLDGGLAYTEKFFPALSEVFEALFTVGKPVVAAVNGHAIAGGCILAAAADVALMADGKGRIGVPELAVGVGFPRIALEILAYKVGEATARKLVLSAGTYGPSKAAGWGLVDHVFGADVLLDEAVNAARALAEGIPADAFAFAKAQLQRDVLTRTANLKDDTQAMRIWRNRLADDWVPRYLASLKTR
ncbi:MAG TPA: enoyl-CoA hydratase/isomerase family protein [Trebonia sp.]|nr:enoyl-CoA hydratase/isomerase family protein [Trebonia sp.]